jgi:polar amino acid transport system permease protein
VVALFVLAVVIQSVAFNPRWEWAVFARWFFDPVILEGVGQTLLLTLIGTALSVVIGGMLALARLSSSWLLSSLAWGYIWLFRSLPLIVVLIILYNFSYLYDTLSLGVPFTGITWGSFETINVLGQFSTAVVGLTWCRAPIPPRSFAADSSGSITASMRPPPRSACPPGVARCASFCLRRCAPFAVGVQ